MLKSISQSQQLERNKKMNKYLKRILTMTSMFLIVILGYRPEIEIAAFRWIYIVLFGLSWIGVFTLFGFLCCIDKVNFKVTKNPVEGSDKITFVLGLIQFGGIIFLLHEYKQDFLMNLNIFFCACWFPVLITLKGKVKEKLGVLS
jgi:hypothetical protein